MREIDKGSADRSLLSGLVGDGRPALGTVGMALAFAGGLAIYLGVTRQLLPHDLSYLGMSASEIDQIADGRLMDFMVHDRVAWGGSLFAVGVMYIWLTAFPLSQGRRWAWLTFSVTGVIGFASFASHLPTGYLDSWHSIGMLLLVPVFAAGIYRSRVLLVDESVGFDERLRSLTWGRRIVIASGFGLAVSAVVILVIGMTVTFVGSDLAFIGLGSSDLEGVSDRLVPLVAHDRVGFAGGVLVGGLLIAAIGFIGDGRAARHAVTIAGLSGFGMALAVHFAVGYTDLLHLAPAMIGPVVLLTGVILWTREAHNE